MQPDDAQQTMSKSERTRAAIRDAAIRSFRERGYEATTIRSLAGELGISTGNAYYHFPTKNHLMQELYREVQESHRRDALPRLEDSSDVIARLRVVYTAGLDQLEPFSEHAAEFLAAAVSPRSELNPLSDESAPSRLVVVELFRQAIDGARHRIPDDIARALPDALLLGHLLLSLFWVYDTSASKVRTRRLLDGGLRLLGMTLPLLRMPPLRAPVRELLALIGEVRT